MKSIIFPPVNISQEMKLRHLLETISDYLDVDIEIGFTIKNNEMLMEASFDETRLDVDELIQSISHRAWVKI